MIASEADTKIYKAVLSDQTSGNGYAILSAISENAIRAMRDIILRPEVYRQTEEHLRLLLADILAEVENGKDIDEARKAAHTKIYQSINPSIRHTIRPSHIWTFAMLTHPPLIWQCTP